jgi:hypothetical protein
MDDLDDIERLVAQSGTAPREQLRAQVLSAVSDALREESRSAWRFVAAAVAAGLLWIHVSWSAALDSNVGLEERDVAEEVVALTEQIHGLLPDLPRHEARRQAVLLRVAERLALYHPIGAKPLFQTTPNPSNR